MTEVPEHLLQRSRERRAALGLGGDDGGAAAGGSSDAPAASAPAPAAAAATPAPAAAAAITPAEPEPPAPPPHYVQASLTRKRIPLWVMPVLAFLPLWGLLYVLTLSEPDHGDEGQLALGAEVYGSCAGCHGAGGGGGVGPAFSDGEILLTFPDLESHLQFVALGSAGFAGGTYGDPDRPGGARQTAGGMPAFDTLTPEELLSVIRHEREVFGGEEIPADQIGPDGELLHPNGEPYIIDGMLV
ncbi:MAG: hypothetical protein JJU45_17855, partial [Acidimicrobiia bacterium]|nr:hypothetical protein [Acidimicrobiia bacterium]